MMYKILIPMSKISTYDVIVIGSGSAGFSAVEAARAQGASVCLIEAHRLGGECPNEACVPSKALLKCASVYRLLQPARDFGIHPGAISFDFSQMMKYRQSVVETITGGGALGDRYVKILRELGVEVKKGKARFVDADLVEVGTEFLRAKAFVIATGTVDFVPPISGLPQIKYARWKDALHFSRLPKSMAIIGGGPVGCELATFFATFGTRVVLLQSAPYLLVREDSEISQLARQALERLKIEVVTSVKILEVVNGGAGVFGVQVEWEGKKKMHAVEQLVLASGNRANTNGLGLGKTRVKLDPQGWILTNAEQQTSAPSIFAVGDVDGGFQFTHTAHHEGSVAGYNAARFAKKKRIPQRKINEQVVPRATFISPEVASVGMTQQEASKRFSKVLIGRAAVSALGRSVTDQARFGLLKMVAHPKTRKVLGGHMIGERAGEVIHEVALAIHLGATVDKLASLIHAYPTFSEVIAMAATNVSEE